MKSYTFRQQIENFGRFATIWFEASADEDCDPGLTLEYHAELRWKLACEAGALLFYDYYGRRKRGSVSIRIERIDWMTVDTDNLCVLFTTMMGLCEHFSLDIAEAGLDPIRKVYYLPLDK